MNELFMLGAAMQTILLIYTYRCWTDVCVAAKQLISLHKTRRIQEAKEVVDTLVEFGVDAEIVNMFKAKYRWMEMDNKTLALELEEMRAKANVESQDS
jgi:hypothetical protein